jgi:hypothetical protein
LLELGVDFCDFHIQMILADSLTLKGKFICG